MATFKPPQVETQHKYKKYVVGQGSNQNPNCSLTNCKEIFALSKRGAKTSYRNLYAIDLPYKQIFAEEVK